MDAHQRQAQAPAPAPPPRPEAADPRPAADDPTVTDPDCYRLMWENELVRVLEYRDVPGTRTHPHDHPNSVMVTLTSFDRRLESGDRTVDVTLDAGSAVWLAAQRHAGTNTGTTPTHTILVELKGAAAGPSGEGKREGESGSEAESEVKLGPGHRPTQPTPT